MKKIGYLYEDILFYYNFITILTKYIIFDNSITILDNMQHMLYALFCLLLEKRVCKCKFFWKRVTYDYKILKFLMNM